MPIAERTEMRVLVIGAAGRTGRLIVERALGHGHDVTAFVHQKPLELSEDRLTSVAGDVRDFDDVSAAVAGKHAVAFAISQASGSGSDVHEAGIANVIHAMAESMVSRLAAVSAAGTFARKDKHLTLKQRTLIATALHTVYEDLEAMELRIMASDLDWTIVRPVALTNDPPSGQYRVSLDGQVPLKSSKIPRADVASLVVKALETDTYWRRSVVIAE
jgi:putative NADH-flavin reductase